MTCTERSDLPTTLDATYCLLKATESIRWPCLLEGALLRRWMENGQNRRSAAQFLCCANSRGYYRLMPAKAGIHTFQIAKVPSGPSAPVFTNTIENRNVASARPDGPLVTQEASGHTSKQPVDIAKHGEVFQYSASKQDLTQQANSLDDGNVLVYNHLR